MEVNRHHHVLLHALHGHLHLHLLRRATHLKLLRRASHIHLQWLRLLEDWLVLHVHLLLDHWLLTILLRGWLKLLLLWLTIPLLLHTHLLLPLSLGSVSSVHVTSTHLLRGLQSRPVYSHLRLAVLVDHHNNDHHQEYASGETEAAA